MNSTPVVSVVIPTFNRAPYLSTAIESLRRQTLSDIEIIVVDDGSTDETQALLARVPDRRLRVIRHAVNQGIATARNAGLDAAEGRYTAVLDSDDFALPERLAKQAAFLDAHPDYAEVGAWGAWMDSDGRLGRKIKQQPMSDGAIRTQLLFTCCINNRSVMGRTEVLRTHRYPTDQRVASDYEMHRRIIQQHKVANLADILVVGRYHADQITRKARSESHGVRRAIINRLLNDIGIYPTQRDLDRHIALWRLHNTDETIDSAFLAWARDWMVRLRAAIPAEHHEIDRALGRIWVELVRTALPRIPVPTLKSQRGGGWSLLARGTQQHLARAVASRRHRTHLPDIIESPKAATASS